MVVQSEVTPGFVIRRKRKRAPAVDPCLGFYPSLWQSPPSSRIGSPCLVDPSKCVVSPQPVMPGIPKVSNVASSLRDNSRYPHLESSIQNTMHTCPDAKEDTAIVTVEDFLRISAKKPTKVYKGRMKCRIVNLGDHQRHSDNSDQLGETETSYHGKGHRIGTIHQPESPNSAKSNEMQTRRRPRRRKPLSDCILRAAVLSHVEADQILGFDEISVPFRRPLPFVKGNGSPKTPRPSRTRRTLTFVDPRKISPFRQAVFSSHSHVNVESIVHKPYTKRRIQTTEHRFARKKGKIQKKELALGVSICPPLSFVPLHDIERISTYEHHTSARDEGVEKTLEYQHVSEHWPTLQVVPIPTLETPSVVKSSVLGSSNAIKFSSPSTILTSPVVISTTDDNSRLLIDVSTTYPIPFACDNLHEIVHTRSDRSNTCKTPNHGPRMSIQTSPTDGMKVNKPLKALASFLDGFLKTARDTIQLQPSKQNMYSDSGQRKRNPQRIRSSNRHREERSFRTKVRTPSRNSGSFTQPTTSNTNALSSSPDILTALRPKNFQILLSSSPSDSCPQPQACHHYYGAQDNGDEQTLNTSVDLFAGFGGGGR